MSEHFCCSKFRNFVVRCQFCLFRENAGLAVDVFQLFDLA